MLAVLRRFFEHSSASFLSGDAEMYTGTLIHDLLRTVENAENLSRTMRAERIEPASADSADDTCACLSKGSEPEQFTQTLRLRPADRNLGLLFVVHPQLVGTLEPGDDLTDTVDIHEVGTVGSPK